jgi:hypothetical protein
MGAGDESCRFAAQERHDPTEVGRIAIDAGGNTQLRGIGCRAVQL